MLQVQCMPSPEPMGLCWWLAVLEHPRKASASATSMSSGNWNVWLSAPPEVWRLGKGAEQNPLTWKLSLSHEVSIAHPQSWKGLSLEHRLGWPDSLLLQINQAEDFLKCTFKRWSNYLTWTQTGLLAKKRNYKKSLNKTMWGSYSPKVLLVLNAKFQWEWFYFSWNAVKNILPYPLHAF